MVELYVPWREVFDVVENAPGVSLARDVAGLACRIRRDRPWLFQVLNNTGAVPPGINPLVANYMWSRVCALFPPAPGDAQCEQFFGGQCPGMQYSIKIFDGNGQEVGTTAPPAGVPVGPLTCINTSVGPPNFVLNNPPIPTGYTVSGQGAQGFWSRSVDTQVATPRRDTRLFTYQIVPPVGQSDNCGNRAPTINLPPVPPSNSVTYEVSIFGQRRNVTVNLPTLDTSNWPDFSWSPVIEFDGINVEFDYGGLNINLPDNVPFFPAPPINNTVNNVNNNLNEIGGTVNNISNDVQTVNNTVNNTQQTVNNISNALQQEFNELNQQLELDIQRILEAIERCCCREGYTLATQVLSGPTAGGRFALPANTVAVLFELELPATDNTPVQEGSGNAERVYHWGSYSISYGVAGEGDRVPLQWERQAVPVAKYATSATIWPTYQNLGRVTAIYEVPPS